ncbi:MAG: transglycosylase domain-containing protein [Dysgonamonadaceae bacterium]|jgi:penicillin-binding protein 1A|nr:transglycosylase domain-containing protein [Dysgonamonadaceae bacterium]
MKFNAKKIILWFWIIFATGIVSLFLIFFLISQGIIGYVPPVEDLENPIDKYASQVISSDNKLLGTYSRERENRIFVTYNDLNPNLVNALIATEDERYRDHSGVDFYALGRVFIKTGIFGEEGAGGGSTITQQLAKLLWSPKSNSFLDRAMKKPIEWVIAVKLERYYTKEEIVNLYLNKFDFLHNAVGIQSAAWVYFGKTPKTLSTEESAVLIGMCKNPSLFNPIRRPELTKGRRNEVLNLMCRNGYITVDERDSLKALPLVLTYNKVDHKDGLAPYFREFLRLLMTAKEPNKNDYSLAQKQKFAEDSLAWLNNPLYGWCNKNKKANGDNYNLHIDGLRIYTTVDSRMQTYAEEAIKEHVGLDLQDRFFKEKKGRSYAPFSRDMKTNDIEGIINRAMKQSDRYKRLKKEGLSENKIRENFDMPADMTLFSWHGLKDTTMTPWDSIKYMKSFLRSGMMSMEVPTGHVKAYVGGVDFQYFQYDMVNTGRRQVGSTIKPFLYSLAMQDGMTPCDQMMHVQPYLDAGPGQAPWEPKNPGGKRIGEMVTIKWGLQVSSNWITANIMSRVSPVAFVKLLRSYGLKGDIDPVVSLCLGTCDVSIAEMVSGYSAFANRGVRMEPVYVTRIEDKEGNTIASFSPQIYDVINEETAFKMLDMLRGVVDGGTAGRLRVRYGITAQMGGKTGTTQNHSDGWFMCFTPTLVSGVWVGGEDRSIHFDGMNNGQAAEMALPVYGLFIQKVYAEPSLGYFQSERFEVSKEYQNPCKNAVVLPYHSTPVGIDDVFE